MALMVWLSYESQTNAVMLILLDLFDYHMNLHYSQTGFYAENTYYEFDYHMNLHYSQTVLSVYSLVVVFDYHMNLHYSQTLS